MTTSMILIPAYKPDEKLVDLVKQLARQFHVVVVNDGSPQAYDRVFDALLEGNLDDGNKGKVELLAHAVNQGKGAALRTGFDYVLQHLPDAAWVITADADGQHTPADIQALAKTAEAADAQHRKHLGKESARGDGRALILGARQFDRDVPPRSMLGNVVTRWALRIFFGISVWDTQTGLRAIPRPLLARFAEIPYNRYELELEMLLAARRSGVAIQEIPIDTIYIENNKSSHYNPLLDSARIFSIMFREQLSALAAGLLDLVVFWIGTLLALPFAFNLGLGRAAAILLNDWLHQQPVFYPHQVVRAAARQTALIWLLSGILAYFVIPLLQTGGMELLPAKLIVEIGLALVIALARRWRD